MNCMVKNPGLVGFSTILDTALDKWSKGLIRFYPNGLIMDPISVLYVPCDAKIVRTGLQTRPSGMHPDGSGDPSSQIS